MMLVDSSDQLPDLTLKLSDRLFLGGEIFNFFKRAITDPNGPAVPTLFWILRLGPWQLEHEFMAGMWFICPASAHHVFETPPEKLWQTILREWAANCHPFDDP